MTADAEQIALLRRFNRTVTRRIGVLQDSFLGRGRPVGESRFLYEIGTEGSDIRCLRARLGLDSGYTSRLLRALEDQGLISTGPSPGDARVRFVKLTATGLKERNTLDRLSDDVAARILSGLEAKQRSRLMDAMATVERLLRASEITIQAEAANSANAQWCLDQYYALLNDRFDEGYDPGNAQPADHRDFAPPGGVFLVARHGDEPVGCIGLRTVSDATGEIKRLWVAETARGMGLGQRLLTRVEDHARESRLEVLRLDTNKSLIEAQALYRKNGYREVPAFNDDPYPDHWFEKTL